MVPDLFFPKDFSPPPVQQTKILGIPLRTKKQVEQRNEERIQKGAERKAKALEGIVDDKDYRPDVLLKVEYLDVITAYHPSFSKYSQEKKNATTAKMLGNNPRYLAEVAQTRNEVSRLPNGPTATRTMEIGEQAFLTNAFRKLRLEFKKHPFHIHGETALVGDRRCKINQMKYSPSAEVSVEIFPGDKYHLHTHPPFLEPFTSSASVPDHRIAAEMYLDFDKMGTYVTNGKDVLHIQPHSTELVKLVPDAALEKKVGKFPVAYQLPTPQPPPYPFANHEAPGTLKPGRLKPKDPPAE